jgi:hypothetical protein
MTFPTAYPHAAPSFTVLFNKTGEPDEGVKEGKDLHRVAFSLYQKLLPLEMTWFMGSTKIVSDLALI